MTPSTNNESRFSYTPTPHKATERPADDSTATTTTTTTQPAPEQNIGGVPTCGTKTTPDCP
jgi:hypothetical protein